MNAFFSEFLQAVGADVFIRVVLVCVAADTIFGAFRAAKYKKWNSSLGIDGGIRKAAMIFSVLFLALVDQIININAIGWLGTEQLAFLQKQGIERIGIAEFFCILYILYEATSIMKNMLLCGIPCPAKLRTKVAKWLDEMTNESSMDIQKEVLNGNKRWQKTLAEKATPAGAEDSE